MNLCVPTTGVEAALQAAGTAWFIGDPPVHRSDVMDEEAQNVIKFTGRTTRS